MLSFSVNWVVKSNTELAVRRSPGVVGSGWIVRNADAVMPSLAASQVAPCVCFTALSILGRTLHEPQRRSEPNQATTIATPFGRVAVVSAASQP